MPATSDAVPLLGNPLKATSENPATFCVLDGIKCVSFCYLVMQKKKKLLYPINFLENNFGVKLLLFTILMSMTTQTFTKTPCIIKNITNLPHQQQLQYLQMVK
jgi:hypothetical protein